MHQSARDIQTDVARGFTGSELHWYIEASVVKLKLDRKLDAVADLHAAITDFCMREALDDRILFAVQLAAEELFTNLVKHNPESGLPIDVGIERAGRRLVLRLTARDMDHFDPSSIPPVNVTAPLRDRRPGGLGLHLIRSYLDTLDMEYRDRTLRITAVKTLEASDVQSSAH